MKRFFLLSLTIVLVISLAAPAGAVFAEADEVIASDDSSVVTDNSVLSEDDAEVEQEQQENPNDIAEVAESETAPQASNIMATTDDSQLEISQEPIVEEPDKPAVASGVIITEVQTRGATDAANELVEIYNASDEDIDVSGWCIQYAAAGLTSNYTNKSCIASDEAAMGMRVLLPARKYAVFTTDSFVAVHVGFMRDGRLGGTMADTGGRIRIINDRLEVVDLLGWGIATEYQGQPAPAIPSSQPLRSLQRVTIDGQYQGTGNNTKDFAVVTAGTEYQTGALYEVVDVCGNIIGVQITVPDGLWRLKDGRCVEKATINFCEGVSIHEIAANVSQQYIELVNHGDTAISIGGCVIATNRSQTTVEVLPDVILLPGQYFVVYIKTTSLKLTKSTTGTVYLIASDTETEIDSVYYEDLSVDTSWSRFSDGWRQTYVLTPETENSYAEYAPCQEGYMRNASTGRCNKLPNPVTQTDCGEGRERNPLTGRCRNLPTARELAPCREGQYRSEETNRCRSIATAAASILKPCADDQFRNPATNRCKKIASSDDVALADCGEGRERNPATNRCRNVTSSTPPAAGFAVEPITDAANVFVGWWVLGGLALVAVGYAGWEWREEILKAIRRVGTIIVGAKK